MNFQFSIFNFQKKGQAAITAVLLMLAILISAIFGASAIALKEARIAEENKKSRQAFFVAEAGVEDAVYRLRTGKNVPLSFNIVLGDSSSSVTLTSPTPLQREIVSRGNTTGAVRALSTLLTSPAEANFPYGAQIDKGGMQAENNVRITGSVYSNGSILGASGDVITGDAQVAGGDPPVIDQSWEIQNSGVNVGTQEGSVMTVVDSSGDVGTYGSLALGSDGLARISYIDFSNTDLKMARCLNDNCSPANLAIVDSGGQVDEVTALAIGNDGFGRMSYYHDGNDDLKFARCLNNDCVSPTLTVVDSLSNTGDFSDIEVGSDGFARIAYWYDSASDVRFIRCTNADCTSKVQTNIETAGSVGEYISLKLGSDGFARMSYYDSTNGDLKFARCFNTDCTVTIITIVDSAGDVGRHTSIVLAADDTPRISYYDAANGDLKFVRCTNIDCTAKNITTVDSSGNVGEYTSLALGLDGFARVSYYDSSNGDLRFARCLNLDCASSNKKTVDNTSSAGKFTSLALGSDGFGRISYYAEGAGDLKYIRCIDADCTPPINQIDVAQGFRLSSTNNLNRVSLYFKKVGSPPNATVRIIESDGSNPDNGANDVVSQGTLTAAQAGSSYGWVDISLNANPSLSSSETYWIVIDMPGTDNSNYYVWGLDNAGGYANGTAKYSSDWTGSSSNWVSLGGDFNFRVWVGVANSLKNFSVNGGAQANTIDNVSVDGDAISYSLNNGTVGGSVVANSISNCTIGGNADYNVRTSCTVGGGATTPTSVPADLPTIPLPISTSTINAWKSEASFGGDCVPPQCQSDGDYEPSGCNVSLGPKRITGKMVLDESCSGGQKLTITGTVWVMGRIDISNNASIKLHSNYGAFSGVVISDGVIHLSNNGVMAGSGQAGSYLMLLSVASGGGHHGSVIDLHNNASGAIFYAGNGKIFLHNNLNATSLVAHTLYLSQNSRVTYESGLSNVKFSSGGSGWDIASWKEIIP